MPIIGNFPSKGIDGREVEIQATDTHIQWRYVGDTAWTDMVALSELIGPDGPNRLSTDTVTALSGLIKGNGSNVAQAVAGEDYMAAKMSCVTLTGSTTLSLAHAEKTLLVNSSSAVTITIPTNASVALPVGTMINVTGIGSGTVSIAAASGVTLSSKDSMLAIDGQYAAVALYKAGTDIWYMWGALV